MHNWDDLRVVLAVARAGSLSAAAVELGVTQPTVSRRIAALERTLEARLFTRTPDGLTPTSATARLLEHVESMERCAIAATRIATGADAALRGTLRVTASEWMCARVLGPIAADFTRACPVTLEIVSDTQWLSIIRAEVDLALRAADFRHQEVIQRKLGEIAFGLYASEDYVARHGEPDLQRGCPGHRLIVMDEGRQPVADVAWLRQIAGEARVVARCNGREPQVVMAREGAGIACLPRLVGDAEPALSRLAAATPPPRPLTLGMHRDARSVPRVRAFVEHLVRALETLRPLLCPDDD